MFKMKFTDKDKENFIEFLNMVAENAEFKFDTKDIIKYFKLLSVMQQTILPKIDANILEMKPVIESPPDFKPENN